MKKNILTMMVATALMAMSSLSVVAQTGTFGTNDFLLQFFTDTGFSHYDWRFEPFKTDTQRGNLKGNVAKVVTNISDKTGRGFGDNFTDTIYYNADGYITKIVALHQSFDPKNVLHPDTYLFEYDGKGLKQYVKYTESVNMRGNIWQAHAHTMERNQQGKIIKEIYRAYSQESKDKWREFTSGDGVAWTFGYDTNGNLTTGKGWLGLTLTYKNDQLVKMQEGNSKPVTFTYDATGRLTSMKFYVLDGMDEVFYTETTNTLTYNEQGDISKAVNTMWDCNSNWQRKRINYSTTYTFAYTYDQRGNWTKAIVYSKAGNDPRRIAFTINRTITYNEKPVGSTTASKSSKDIMEEKSQASQELLDGFKMTNGFNMIELGHKMLSVSNFKAVRDYIINTSSFSFKLDYENDGFFSADRTIGLKERYWMSRTDKSNPAIEKVVIKINRWTDEDISESLKRLGYEELDSKEKKVLGSIVTNHTYKNAEKGYVATLEITKGNNRVVKEMRFERQ